MYARQNHRSFKRSDRSFQMYLMRRILGGSNREKPSVCPYCSVQLDARPTRSKVCASCSATIYARRGNRGLLTEEQSLKLDESSEGDLKLGSDPRWQKLNANLKKATSSSYLELMKMLYFQMSIQQHEAGRDNYQFALESRKSYLLLLQELGLDRTRAETKTVKGDACGECRP